jgi:hypothetical protein
MRPESNLEATKFEAGHAHFMTNKERILECAVEIVKQAPHGIRYSELLRRVQERLPQISKNTIRGNVWNLDVTVSGSVYKPSRGVFLHTQFREKGPPPAVRIEPVGADRLNEERFYEPSADWLVHELEECTKAIPIGGNKFKDKWGTPDVIGIREPRKSDIVKFSTEIVSAEIKLDSAGLIVAFGQACAYRLFGHKSYIVVPLDANEDDVARLDTLARIFGIGLILFNSASSKDPRFEIRVRAAKHEPDMFYVNRYMKLIEDELFS